MFDLCLFSIAQCVPKTRFNFLLTCFFVSLFVFVFGFPPTPARAHTHSKRSADAMGGGRNIMADNIEQAGGLDKIEALQMHQHPKIYETANHIIVTYYPEDEAPELVPVQCACNVNP